MSCDPSTENECTCSATGLTNVVDAWSMGDEACNMCWSSTCCLMIGTTSCSQTSDCCDHNPDANTWEDIVCDGDTNTCCSPLDGYCEDPSWCCGGVDAGIGCSPDGKCIVDLGGACSSTDDCFWGWHECGTIGSTSGKCCVSQGQDCTSDSDCCVLPAATAVCPQGYGKCAQQ